jgi:hypothetical protein
MNLYIDISTFDSLKNKGKIIVSIINWILDGALFPLNFELKVLLEKFNERFLSYKLNKKNWMKICDMLISGEVRHIMISYKVGEFIQPYFSISCTTDLAYEDALYVGRKIANNFAVSINLGLFNGKIPSITQSNIIKFYMDTFKILNGIVGYINITSGHASLYPNPSEYECSLRHGSTDYLAESFDQRCRGFHWSNILTEGHINKLGGIELIKEKSPCFLNEEFTMDNGSKALFMQLTEDINSVSEQEFIRLKEYLEPILPLASQY